MVVDFADPAGAAGRWKRPPVDVSEQEARREPQAGPPRARATTTLGVPAQPARGTDLHAPPAHWIARTHAGLRRDSWSRTANYQRISTQQVPPRTFEDGVARGRRMSAADEGDNLRLNWRLLQAPRRLIEYVAAHELLHLRHEHHTAAFWADLGRGSSARPGARRRCARMSEHWSTRQEGAFITHLDLHAGRSRLRGARLRQHRARRRVSASPTS